LGYDISINSNPNIFIDCLSNEFDTLLKHTANRNTLTYREIFKCVPDDTFLTFKDIKHMPREFDIDPNVLNSRYFGLRNNIIGQIVEYPLKFLEGEKLNRSFFSIERFVPLKLFI
jgi:hypothetical protein